MRKRMWHDVVDKKVTQQRVNQRLMEIAGIMPQANHSTTNDGEINKQTDDIDARLQYLENL
jgi:hypothetical protein